MLASGMQAADATIANVALPQLEHDLGGGIALGAWVVTGYLCATAIVAPLTGWLRRRFGARTLFTAAVGAFAVASLLCSLAPSGATIVVFRILQGAGGGVIHPLAQAILLDLYPREQHGRMIAAWGATIMLGPILGPALGGIITDLTSWRFVFAVNLPLAAVAIWAMRRALPKIAPSSVMPLDMLGVGLLAIGVGALQLSLARGVGQSWLDSPELMIEVASAVIAFAALAARAPRIAAAVFRPAVLSDINFAVAAFYNFVMSALLFVVVVFVPALCQGPLGYSATTAGLAIVPRGIATMLVMLVVGQLIERIDGRILLAIGVGLMAAGLAMLAAARPPDALTAIIIGSTLQALGGGILITCLSTIGFSTLAPELRTDAAGVYSLLRQLGCASGVALMTAILRVQLDAKLLDLRNGLDPPGTATSPHFLDIAGLEAYSSSFRAMAIAALITLPGVLLFRAPARGSRMPARLD
jgi:DHA2 family multidrug resistance protein